MHIDTMAKRARQAGFIATALTAAITARFGYIQGEDAITSVVYAGGLGLASFLVGYGLVFAWTAYKRQMPWTIVIASVAVFSIAVVVEVLSHVGANASARTHDIAKASEQTNTYRDTRGELERARNDLAQMKATRSPSAISADMAGLEVRPWFASTNSCATPGSYGNSCRRYIALKGELGQAQERASLDKRVQALASQAATSTAGHSVVASQASAIASYATWTVRPSEDDKAKTNMVITLIMAAYFVSLGLLNLVAQAFDPDPDTAKAEPTAEIIPMQPRYQAPAPSIAPPVNPLSKTTIGAALENLRRAG